MSLNGLWAQAELGTAVQFQDIAEVWRLVESGVDPNHVIAGHTPTLHLAATLGLGDMVEVLVEAGANPAVTNKGLTIMQSAAAAGVPHLHALQKAIDNGLTRRFWDVPRHRSCPDAVRDWVKTVMLCGRQIMVVATAVHAGSNYRGDPKLVVLIKGGLPPLPSEMWLEILTKLHPRYMCAVGSKRESQRVRMPPLRLKHHV
eukprot:m.184158 g.184158  ORF g.184158 m.184158 type:complete len:201 (-) comp24683_c0_seq3:398-1000(-)